MARDTFAQLNDEALVVLYANGDPDAARVLAQRLLPRIVSYAGRLLMDRTEAEDIAQEAMLRLWRVAPDWRQDQAKVSTWVYRVVTNLCTDRHRARKRWQTEGFDKVAEPEDATPGVLAGMINADRMAALDAALACLPDRQREAVVLRHIEGLTNPQIAEVLQINVEAVESLTARGKRALTTALAGQRQTLGYKEV